MRINCLFKNMWVTIFIFLTLTVVAIGTIDFNKKIKNKYMALAVIEDVQLSLDTYGPTTTLLILKVEGKDQRIKVRLPDHALIFKDKRVILECIEFNSEEELCTFISYEQ
ncbi:hypothetical protein ACU6U9_05540 [Pseudomonas sp. HK3]